MRHGEADSNLNVMDRTVGEYANLTAKGRLQAEDMAELLAQHQTFDKLYSSPYPRTLETATIIATRLNIPIHTDVRLQEIQKGDWEGRPVREVVQLEAEIDIDQRHTFRPPNGENWHDVGARVAAFANELLQKDVDQVITISHDHPIRMGIGALLCRPIMSWEDMEILHASVHILQHDGNAWHLQNQG